MQGTRVYTILRCRRLVGARATLGILLGVFLSAAPGAKATEPVDLLFHTRAPYMMPLPDGSVAGLTADRAAAAFSAAQVPYVWREVPPQEQLALVRDNRHRVCALGWFRNDARAAFALFSAPLYADMPQAILARTDDPAVGLATTLDHLVTDRSRTLLVRNGYSYGQALDRVIARLSPPTRRTDATNLDMLWMILEGEADYMFVSSEEGRYLLRVSGLAGALRLWSKWGLPTGEDRHLMCSQKVGADLMARLDQYLRSATD